MALLATFHNIVTASSWELKDDVIEGPLQNSLLLCSISIHIPILCAVTSSRMEISSKESATSFLWIDDVFISMNLSLGSAIVFPAGR